MTMIREAREDVRVLGATNSSAPNSPTPLAGRELPRGVRPSLAELPEFLDKDWDEDVPVIKPTILPVAGGHPFFYEGESHSLSGPGGAGKTFLAAFAIASLVRNNKAATAVFVDYEGNRASFKERMKALGVTRSEAARIAYWSLSCSLMSNTASGRAWLNWVDLYLPGFVVIDSVSKACAAAGLNDDNNPEYQRWDNGVIVPLTQRGITTLRIDHTGHASMTGSGGSRPRGASAKTDAVSGAAFLFQPIEHWTRENDGSARIKCLKDRFGHHKAGAIVALLNVIVQDAGRKLTMELVAPASSSSAVEEAGKSLTAPSRVLRALKVLGTWASKKDVQAWDADHRPTKLDGELAGFLNADTCYTAMKRLVKDGAIKETAGVHGTMFAVLECDDELPGGNAGSSEPLDVDEVF